MTQAPNRVASTLVSLTTMDIQTSIADLNAVLERTPFLKPYGFTVQSCAMGECVLRGLGLHSPRGSYSTANQREA